MSEVTRILDAIRQGDPHAAAQLLPLVYDELRKLAAAAEAMRRILVDNARRRRRPKHGGGRQRVELDQACSLADDGAEQVLLVSDAPDELAQQSPDKAAFVKLRFFAGLSAQQAAEAMGISRATGDRYWSYAKVFLYCALEDDKKS